MKRLAIFAAAALMTSTSAFAAPDYDRENFIVLDGRVENVDWSGENMEILFWSNDGYGGVDWTLVGPSIEKLRAMGWTEDSIKPGDRVDAIVNPDKNGTPTAELQRFLFDDYSTLETSHKGSTAIFPPGTLKKTLPPEEDPLITNYGNTRTCRATNPDGPASANYACRLYVNADHTMQMVEANLLEDGTWEHKIDTGVWWLEQQLDKLVACTLIDGAAKPRCHAPVEYHEVGDEWSIEFIGREATWTEYRQLLEGRQ